MMVAGSLSQLEILESVMEVIATHFDLTDRVTVLHLTLLLMIAEQTADITEGGYVQSV